MPDGLDPYQSASVSAGDALNITASSAIAQVANEARQMASSNQLSGVVANVHQTQSAGSLSSTAVSGVVSLARSIPAAAETTASYTTEAISTAYRDVAGAGSVAASASRDMLSRLTKVRNVMTPPLSYIPPQFAPMGQQRDPMSFTEALTARAGLFLSAPRGMLREEYKEQARENLLDRWEGIKREVAFGGAELAGGSAGAFIGGLVGGGLIGAVAGGILGSVAAPTGYLRDVAEQRSQVSNILRATSWRYMRGDKLTREKARSVSRDIVGSVSGTDIGVSDVGALTVAATEMGVFDTARNEEQIVNKFKGFVKKVDSLMTQLDVSAEEAVQRLASKNPALINPDYYSAIGQATGLSSGELNRAGQASAAMFRGTGIDPTMGYNLGVQAMGAARNIQTRNVSGQRFIQGFGGLAEAQNQIVQSQATFMQSPQMAMMLGAFANERGRLDPERMNAFLSQGGGIRNLTGMFSQNLQRFSGDIAWQSRLNMNMQENISAIPPEVMSTLMVQTLTDQARAAAGREWEGMDEEARKAYAINMAPSIPGLSERQARLMIETIDPDMAARQGRQFYQAGRRRLRLMEEKRSGLLYRFGQFRKDLTRRAGEGLRDLWGGATENLGTSYRGVWGAVEGLGDWMTERAGSSRHITATERGVWGGIGNYLGEVGYYYGGGASADRPDIEKNPLYFTERNLSLAEEYGIRRASSRRGKALEGDMMRAERSSRIRGLIEEGEMVDTRSEEAKEWGAFGYTPGTVSSEQRYEVKGIRGRDLTKEEARALAEEQYDTGKYRVSRAIRDDRIAGGTNIRKFLETGMTKREVALEYGLGEEKGAKEEATKEARGAIEKILKRDLQFGTGKLRNLMDRVEGKDLSEVIDEGVGARKTGKEAMLEKVELIRQEAEKASGQKISMRQAGELIPEIAGELLGEKSEDLIDRAIRLGDGPSVAESGYSVKQSAKTVMQIMESDQFKELIPKSAKGEVQEFSKEDKRMFMEHAFELNEVNRLYKEGRFKDAEKLRKSLQGQGVPNKLIGTARRALAEGSGVKDQILTHAYKVATEKRSRQFKQDIADVESQDLNLDVENIIGEITGGDENKSRVRKIIKTVAGSIDKDITTRATVLADIREAFGEEGEIAEKQFKKLVGGLTTGGGRDVKGKAAESLRSLGEAIYGTGRGDPGFGEGMNKEFLGSKEARELMRQLTETFSSMKRLEESQSKVLDRLVPKSG